MGDVDYGHPDPSGGAQERRLYLDARGSAVPMADILHARHGDSCPVCADNAVCHDALQRENARILSAYDALQRGLFLIQRRYRDADTFDGAPPDLPSLLESLERLSESAGRYRRG